MDNAIFYPMFAQAILTLGVLVLLARRRFGAIKAGETGNLAYFKTFAGESPEPEGVRQAQRNLTNLFEIPMLLYPACLAAAVFGKVDMVTLGLAWAYVGLRFMHTVVHVTSNNVPLRFKLFLGSSLVMMALWGRLAF